MPTRSSAEAQASWPRNESGVAAPTVISVLTPAGGLGGGVGGRDDAVEGIAEAGERVAGDLGDDLPDVLLGDGAEKSGADALLELRDEGGAAGGLGEKSGAGGVVELGDPIGLEGTERGAGPCLDGGVGAEGGSEEVGVGGTGVEGIADLDEAGAEIGEGGPKIGEGLGDVAAGGHVAGSAAGVLCDRLGDGKDVRGVGSERGEGLIEKRGGGAGDAGEEALGIRAESVHQGGGADGFGDGAGRCAQVDLGDLGAEGGAGLIEAEEEEFLFDRRAGKAMEGVVPDEREIEVDQVPERAAGAGAGKAGDDAEVGKVGIDIVEVVERRVVTGVDVDGGVLGGSGRGFCVEEHFEIAEKRDVEFAGDGDEARRRGAGEFIEPRAATGGVKGWVSEPGPLIRSEFGGRRRLVTCSPLARMPSSAGTIVWPFGLKPMFPLNVWSERAGSFTEAPRTSWVDDGCGQGVLGLAKPRACGVILQPQ